MPSYEYPRPALTADLIALCFHEAQLKILLIQRASDPFKGSWALPGGFVDQNESPQQAAARELKEEAGLTLTVEDLIEVGSFGAPGRDPRSWVVTVAMMALVPLASSSHQPLLPQLKAGDDARLAQWFTLPQLAELPLAFDHTEIVAQAIKQLQILSLHQPDVLRLLPKPFRHRQIRILYNQIWGKALSPREFKAWLRRIDAIERVGRSLYQPSSKSFRKPWERP